MSNRINPPIPDGPTSAEMAGRLLAEKIMGHELTTPTNALDRAIAGIRFVIQGTIAGINSGQIGEPTPEDLQRCHVLKSLLDDLP